MSALTSVAFPPSRRSRRTAAGLGVVLAAAAVGCPLSARASTTPTGTTRLTREVVHGLANDTDLGVVRADAPMRIAVALDVDTAARDAAATAIFSKGSPSYHAFLTPAAFNRRFGVDRALAAHVRDVATAHGLSVVYDAPDGSYLELAGTTGQVDRTFSISEHTYRAAGGRTFTANANAPQVPKGVAAVLGLTSLTRFQTAAMPAPRTQDTCMPAAGTVGGLTAGPSGACLGVTVPSDLWSVYHQPSTNRGAGQKVAIFGEGKVDDVISDLRIYEKDEKLPTVPVRKVLVGDNLQDDAGAGEWDLDSAATTGMAPDMQELDYYFGSDLSDASIGGTYSAWANDPRGPLTGNSSFGGSEQLEYLGGFILDRLLQQAAMEGRTMFASSGDVGGDCLPGANGVTNQGVPCVEYPASSPYVVGVGGTVLYTATKDATGATQRTPAVRADEYSWNYSGGGQSNFEPAPAYQVKALPGQTAVPCALGAHVGQPCRGVPDVSAQSGDIATNGYAIVSAGKLTESGGTSLSSPLWAGMWARVLAAHPAGCSSAYTPKSTTLGFAQEDLYNLANDPAQDVKDFFDVGGTTASMPSSNGQQQTLPRTPAIDPTGYDYVSGLGTPDITNIAKALDCGNTAAVTANKALPPVTTLVYTSTAGCPRNGTITDPVGDEVLDATTGLGAPATVGPAFDLTKVQLTNTGKAITFSTTVKDLSSLPTGDVNYQFQFKYGSGAFAVSADRGLSSNTFSLYSLAVTSTPIGLGLEVNPTDLSDALTGTITGNVITATLPLALFNSLVKPATPLAVGRSLAGIAVYSDLGPAAAGVTTPYNAEPIDQAEFFQCVYTLHATAVGRPVVTSPGRSTGTGAATGNGASGRAGTGSRLATTGLNALVPAGAVILLASGLLLLRRRRQDL